MTFRAQRLGDTADSSRSNDSSVAVPAAAASVAASAGETANGLAAQFHGDDSDDGLASDRRPRCYSDVAGVGERELFIHSASSAAEHPVGTSRN